MVPAIIYHRKDYSNDLCEHGLDPKNLSACLTSLCIANPPIDLHGNIYTIQIQLKCIAGAKPECTEHCMIEPTMAKGLEMVPIHLTD